MGEEVVYGEVCGEVFMFLTVELSLFSCIFNSVAIVAHTEFPVVINSAAKDTPTDFPVVIMGHCAIRIVALWGIRLVSEVWVLVIRGLVFIVFNCVDLIIFSESVVWGWLAFLVS